MIEIQQRPICDSTKGGLDYSAKVPVILQGRLECQSITCNL